MMARDSRMQRVPGQRGREPQCLGGIGSGPAMAVHDRDLAARERAGLVEHHGVDAGAAPPAPGAGAPARPAAPAHRPQPAVAAGVASDKAHGQVTISTATATLSACAGPADHHHAAAAARRSARPAGTGWRCDRRAGPAAASRPTRAPSWQRCRRTRVCSPARSTWTVTMPVRLWLPATTGCPSPRDKARDSPVSSASSTRVWPAITVPSAGNTSPGSTRIRSPAASWRTAHAFELAVGRQPLDRIGHSASQGFQRPCRPVAKPLLQQPPGQQEEDEHR